MTGELICSQAKYRITFTAATKQSSVERWLHAGRRLIAGVADSHSITAVILSQSGTAERERSVNVAALEVMNISRSLVQRGVPDYFLLQ